MYLTLVKSKHWDYSDALRSLVADTIHSSVLETPKPNIHDKELLIAEVHVDYRVCYNKSLVCDKVEGQMVKGNRELSAPRQHTDGRQHEAFSTDPEPTQENILYILDRRGLEVHFSSNCSWCLVRGQNQKLPGATGQQFAISSLSAELKWDEIRGKILQSVNL